MNAANKVGIDAGELRIGNLLRWEDDSNDIVSIQGIKFDKECEVWDVDYKETSRDEFGACMLDEFIPIPLTAEILEKWCGFEPYPFDARDIEMDIEYYMLQMGGGQISFYDDGTFYVSNTHSPDFYGALAKIEYLHQLQNLYFALTGEELPINITPLP